MYFILLNSILSFINKCLSRGVLLYVVISPFLALFAPMFGVEFTLNLLMDVILDVKPSNVSLGAHHYVQLAESDVLDQVDPEKNENQPMINASQYISIRMPVVYTDSLRF